MGDEVERILPVPLGFIVENLIRGGEESAVDEVDDPSYAVGEGICPTVEEMYDGLICLSNANDEHVGGLSEVDIIIP